VLGQHHTEKTTDAQIQPIRSMKCWLVTRWTSSDGRWVVWRLQINPSI